MKTSDQESATKVVVITGSTRGIGYGLAKAFLDLGCSVVVSGRTADHVYRAVEGLSEGSSSPRVFGQSCDVTQFNQVLQLWDAAHRRFGKIDIWINNAGLSHDNGPLWELDPGEVQAVVDTNLTGVLYGSMVALQGMRSQGFGALYNMEGLGSTGRQVAGLTVYGATKAGLRYLTEALTAEVQGLPILVGALSPGMVVTEMLTRSATTRPQEWPRIRRIFNILADRVETVAPWLAGRVLENDRNGVRISWLTRGRIMGRFVSAPFRRRDLFEEN